MAVGAQTDSEPLGPLAVPDAHRFLNRELSRLDFDERVLGMAEDPRLPLLERVRFLAIFSQNLDDFFQVRVAGLKEQVLAAVAVASPDGMSPLDQLKAIRSRVEGLVERQVSLGDVFATVYKAMGIQWDKEYMTPVGRPIKIANSLKDATGEPIKELV